MEETIEDAQLKCQNIEWLKQRLTAVWNSTRFCGLCLNSFKNLNSVHMEFVISRQKNSQSLIDIMNYLFNDNIENIMSSTYVCDQCTEKALQSYIFIRNTKQLSKIIRNCIMDINNKVIDISEQVLESVDCENSNVMLVLENDTELYEEINDLTAANEIIPTNKPIVNKYKLSQEIVVPKSEDKVDSSKSKQNLPTDRRFVKTHRVVNKLIASKDQPLLEKYPIKIEDVDQSNLSNSHVQKIADPEECSRLLDAITSGDVPVVNTPNVPVKTEIVNKKETPTELVTTRIIESNVEKNKANKDISIEDSSPVISLEKGKIVIKPIKTAFNMPTVPSYTTFKCTECPDIFTTYRSLKDHEKLKHRSQIYQCKLCDKSYNTQQYLNLHYKSHSKSRCKICQVILSEEELFTHLRQNHANLVFACKFCELVYYNEDALATHFKTSHLVNDTSKNSKCEMCLKEMSMMVLKTHRCKFSCPDCFVMPCTHYDYLVAYREQILNHGTKVNCIDCDYVTHRKECLITHVNREHLDHHPFTCNDCGMQFYTKISLRNHIDQYHINNVCEYCDEEFKKRKILSQHRKVCKTTKREFPCFNCKASFDTEEEYDKHNYLRHCDGGYDCKLCHRRFIEEAKLEEHQVTAHSRVQFKKRRKNIECSLCEIKFNNVKELSSHEDTHEPGTMFPCKKCNKKFVNLKKLYVHQARHYDRITCPGCKKRIVSVFYPQHAVRCVYMREPGNLQICEVCGKTFHLESLLQLHQKTHNRVKCQECGKSVKASSIHHHMRAHGGNKYAGEKNLRTVPKIECKICGHLLRKKVDLDAHMNRYHLKVKPYMCHVCNKSFCGKPRLNEHLLTHTDNNSCFCSICGKKFANKVCLKMHMRIHTGESPYTCDLCGQKFRSSSIMKTHRLKKHLEKNVACPGCDNMFHIVREMRHHFKTVHWKDKHRPFNYKEAVDPKYYHLFEDRRLAYTESDVIIETA